jgi:hypothetical protein
MCVVDSWLIYSKCTETEEKQCAFYKLLAEEMIANQHDQVRGRWPVAESGSPAGLITAEEHMHQCIPNTHEKEKEEKGDNGGGSQY